MEIYDHLKKPVEHGKARVNGIIMHYITAGEGEPLLLLHGTPKTNCYWHRLIPLLTDKFKIIAPDLRGFGYSDKPGAEQGYDSLTMVQDLNELMEYLGINKFCIHGEDRGAEYGFVYAAKYPEKIKWMSYGEMAISGYGIEEASFFTEENIKAQYNNTGKWLWHVPFFYTQNVPEMLLQGHECEFWDFLLKGSSFNPDAHCPELLEEWHERFTSPGGMRGILETYRAEFKNIRINQEILKKGKLKLPVITFGGIEFYGVTVQQHASKIFGNIQKSVVLEKCGHHMAIEQPEKMAKELREFMLKHVG